MKVLVVSPHPDDETLGAGGTLLKLKKAGHQAYWLNITDIKPGYGWDAGLCARRGAQVEAVKEFYGFDGAFSLGLQPAALSSEGEGRVIEGVRAVLEQVRPGWLILPGPYDAHSDHRIVYSCCMACAKAFRAPYIRRVTTMEVLSETEHGFHKEKFEPNLIVDITEELEGKLEAMKLYDTELGEAPFPRSLENIRALASVRGSGVCRYAEAFAIVRQIE